MPEININVTKPITVVNVDVEPAQSMADVDVVVMVGSGAGTNGKSAYQLAVEEGFVGTLQEWLDSLDGEEGPPGVTILSAAPPADPYPGLQWFNTTNGKIYIYYDDFWIQSANMVVSIPGSDGREVEFQNNGTYIQWRYVGDVGWTNLVLLSDLKGDPGDPGDPGEGVAAGGTTGQILAKQSNADYDTQWIAAPSGLTATTTATLTLLAANWSGNVQVLTVTGVTTTSTNLIQIDSIVMGDRWGAAKVYATAQAANEITFTCDTTPTENIEFKVVILK
jgi:hypothetical protein